MQIAETLVQSRQLAQAAPQHNGPRKWRPARPWDTDRAARDRAYTPSSCVPDLAPYLQEYAERSVRAREQLPWCELSYGPTSSEVLHFFPASEPRAPLHVYIHGGYWQELGESDSSFAAPDVVARGAAFAALGYGLAPKFRLDEIVEMVRRGVLWLYLNSAELGVDPTRVYLSGSSAGAHLAAMCLLDGWLPEPLRPRDLVCGATLLSGVYELEPLRHTYVGEAIGLGADEAARNSPVRHLGPDLPPVIVARGSAETVAFIDEHDALVGAVNQLGSPVTDLVVGRRNHFDLPLGLADHRDVLGKAVLAQMEAGSPDLTHRR